MTSKSNESNEGIEYFENEKLKIKVPIINSTEEMEQFISERIIDKKIQTKEDFDKLCHESGQYMKDLSGAAKLLKETILNKKKIKFVNDSDVDGLGTNVLTYRFFKDYIQYPVKIVITDRKQGYGFLPLHIQEEDPYDLYITADNGITAVPATKKAKEMGADVIITDHHMPEEVGLPEANFIVDPMQKDDSFEFKEISGTVVLYIFLRETLKEFYPGNQEILDKWYYDSIDMMGLTTISDVMPLNISINRFIVKEFISLIHNETLEYEYLNIFKKENTYTPLATDFSFGLIPALNSTNRMTSAVEGFTFLIQEVRENAEQWYKYLIDLNNARKEKQQTLLSYIEKHYKEWIKGKNFILIPGQFKEEYKGVLGIIAGRLAEKYKKPCVVLNLSNGVYAGSGRSVGDINILGVFREIQEEHPEWISHVGGHKVALGVGIKQEYINDIFISLQEKISKFPEEAFVSKKEANFYLDINTLGVLDLELYNDLIKFEPFGQKFEKPVFISETYIKGSRKIGKQKNHMSLTLTDQNGYVKIPAMWFFFNEDMKELDPKKEYYVLWQPDVNEFPKGTGNIKLSLRIVDIIEK